MKYRTPHTLHAFTIYREKSDAILVVVSLHVTCDFPLVPSHSVYFCIFNVLNINISHGSFFLAQSAWYKFLVSVQAWLFPICRSFLYKEGQCPRCVSRTRMLWLWRPTIESSVQAAFLQLGLEA